MTQELKLATFAEDFWELRSGEKAHTENPQKCWIPELTARQNLKRGDGAKLFFDFEIENVDGKREIRGEKMWVIVTERCDDMYRGILENQPAGIDEGFLDKNSEILFKPEHVVDIDRPPDDYLIERFGADFLQNE